MLGFMSIAWGSKGPASQVWWLIFGIIALVVLITSQQKGVTSHAVVP